MSAGCGPRVDLDSLRYAIARSGLAGLSVGGLARRAGIGKSTLENVLSGWSRDPHGSTVIRLARALGVDPADLYEGLDD